ncbi:hypothetical protein BC831DRAFT_454204 [Entophlyctis helioformis]|nr:hypothetical protein BC831DRAFT_454204 [Entophlyctis helioformis]
MQRLEFTVSVYFAVYPLIPNVSRPSTTMDAFKRFLETRGAELSKSPQFLQFYALPYVPDPRQHPSFVDIFSATWVPDLESRLTLFLEKTLAGKVRPRLLSLADNLDERPSAADTRHLVDEIKVLKRQIMDKDLADDQIRTKLRQLQSDYHNLITIASELVHTLALCINGEKITPAYLSSIVQKLSAFKKGTQAARPSQTQQIQQQHASMKPPAPLSKPPSSETGQLLQHRLYTRASPAPSPFYGMVGSAQMDNDALRHLPIEQRLDYGQMERVWLADASDWTTTRRQAFLFQALRFRLLRAPNGMARRAMLHTMIDNDILGIRQSKGLLMHVLDGQSPDVKEQLARLMNMVATDCAGREYLLSRDAYIIPQVVAAMKHDPVDSVFRQNLLGALQKLSLRRVGQSAMNNLHVITYLQDTFTSLDALSDYTIEYGTALLMNLCLRTAGKRECSLDPSRTLSILNELIEHDNLQVKTYVNGTLYSVLSEPSIRARARAIGMEEQLRYLRQVSDEQLVKQIDFVIDRLNGAGEGDDVSEDGDEDDNVDDEDDLPVFDDEEGEDMAPKDATELTGDALLEQYAFPRYTALYRNTRLSCQSANASYMDKHHSTATVINSASDFKRAMTPSRPQTPGNARRVYEQPPVLHRQHRAPPAANVPRTQLERADFDMAFSTRAKLARTPTFEGGTQLS